MLGSPVSAIQGYREKYANVLRHYSQQATDSLKYKAALFIIDNMEGHCSPEGVAMDKYIAHIQTMKKAKERDRTDEDERTGGVGVQNVNTRLRLYYGEKYGLHFESTLGEGTDVTIKKALRRFFSSG